MFGHKKFHHGKEMVTISKQKISRLFEEDEDFKVSIQLSY